VVCDLHFDSLLVALHVDNDDAAERVGNSVRPFLLPTNPRAMQLCSSLQVERSAMGRQACPPVHGTGSDIHLLRSFVGLAKTIYMRCIYGILGREIIKYTVYIYGSGQPYSFEHH
jgi:hypothetical protein